MAPKKRKAEDTVATDRSSSSHASSKPKKPRRDSQNDTNTAPTIERKPPKSSVLSLEEKAFPRGGGDGLTALEHKQIQIQATRDVLIEEAGKKKSRQDKPEDGDDSDDFEDEPADDRTAKKKPRRKSQAKNTKSDDVKERRIRIQGLRPKRLLPGSTVLAQVSQVSDNNLTLDLPNNLTGNVAITAVSSELTAKLEAVLEQDNESDDASDDQEDSTSLKNYFKIGQYLRACVVSTEETSEITPSKTHKRIELTLEPSDNNRGVTSTTVPVNSMLQASVVSVEDHGVIMRLGLDGEETKGFMSSKEIPLHLQYTDIKAGMVMLCLVTGLSSNGKVVKLSGNQSKAGDIRKGHLLSDAPTIDAILPGAAVELLITQTNDSTVAGKVLGLLDATVDSVHSGAGPLNIDVESKYKTGSKTKARVIFVMNDGERRITGLSLLDHVLGLKIQAVAGGPEPKKPLDVLSLSAKVDEAKITNVEPGLGIYTDIGVKGIPGFVHTSRLSDQRVDTLSKTTGSFRSGTTHAARIIGYNALDGLYLVSMQPSTVNQRFLRVEDVPVGDVVKAKIVKLVVNASGVSGVVLDLVDGLTGFVPEIHLSDIHLQHPEKKFKEGLEVRARVLSIDSDKKQVRLTLKKTLVNSDAAPWAAFESIAPGDQSPGSIVKLSDKGAVVQFYGNVKAFLPTSQMSEAFVEDPKKHFRLGQAITVRALQVDAAKGRMTVSCKMPSDSEVADDASFKKLRLGDLVSGTITAKSEKDVTIDLDNSKLKATLPFIQLTDGSLQDDTKATERFRVGRLLKDLVILQLFEQKRSILLTKKPSLVSATKQGKLITSIEDVHEGNLVVGYISNITDQHGVFVRFAGSLTGLLHKFEVGQDKIKLPDFGYRVGQSISARVTSVDLQKQQFALTTRPVEEKQQKSPKAASYPEIQQVINPIDENLKSLSEIAPGLVTKAKVTSVKDSQLNVHLADNLQGRIDVSEIFNSWEDIRDRKSPLRSFHAKQELEVRVLGVHDARNHRFLPFSHRGGKVPVFELSTKVNPKLSIASLDQVKQGEQYAAFVNNVSDACLWVNLSPNVRGRIERMDISEDMNVSNDLDAHFTIGSALRVWVKNVDVGKGHLDLTAKNPATSEKPITIKSISQGQILAGRVTKVSDRAVFVQLSPEVSGSVALTDLADDYDGANPEKFRKNDVLRVSVLDVDVPNKRVALSARPSKVLSSSLPVMDKSYTKISQLKVNDLVRGFIKNVADIGLFVSLSHNVTALVRVSDLSDSFLKDWKSHFEVDRLVSGKIIAVDDTSNHLLMSLKSSVVSDDYVAPISFSDIKAGQIVTGKVRKVMDFGAFIVVDNSQNVSGLCHRSEVAEQRVEDASKLYSEGDAVKAKVLKIEPEKRRISFGLKASYFQDEEDSDDESDEGAMLEEVDEMSVDDNEDGFDSVEGVDLPLDQEDSDMSSGSEGEEVGGPENISDVSDDDGLEMDGIETEGLDAGGFDWSGAPKRALSPSQLSEPDAVAPASKKKRSHKATIYTDHTRDLDAHGPQTSDDFERLLLGQRDDADLWVRYMAHHLNLSEFDTARSIAERALKEIGITRQSEKLDVWTAWLNLELAYGSPDTVEEIFQRALAVTDRRELHERMADMYTKAGMHDKADALYTTMASTRSLGLSATPDFWSRYAAFLLNDLGDAARARALPQRASQSVPAHARPALLLALAQLEFRSPHGDVERGRTLLEGLLSAYPRRGDLWDVYVALEGARGEAERARELYGRMTAAGAPRMKRVRGAKVFKAWLAFESRQGDAKRVTQVKARQRDWEERMAAEKEERAAAGQADDE